jgi:cation diffusion facilitator family transporter
MHVHTASDQRHDHAFLGAGHARNERRTVAVIALTVAMMVAEIVAGLAFGSMALLADGMHMATHAGALALSAAAYAYARRNLHNPAFAFGTGKVGDLAAFASAILLAGFAALIAWESVGRLLDPRPIDFGDATLVAVLGLAVNLASAWMLRDHHHHDHDDHAHRHGTGGHDHNLRAAYIHVLADALTSVLAIVGLLAGAYAGWVWMDPLVGLVGAAVIIRWSWGLLRDASHVLLDAVPDARLADEIRATLEQHRDRVTDLHVWHVGPDHIAAIISLATPDPKPPSHYKARLAAIGGLCHVTVEVEPSAWDADARR